MGKICGTLSDTSNQGGHQKPGKGAIAGAAVAAFLTVYMLQPGVHSWLNQYLFFQQISVWKGLLFLALPIGGILVSIPLICFYKKARKPDYQVDVIYLHANMEPPSSSQKKQVIRIGIAAAVFSAAAIAGLLLAFYLCPAVHSAFSQNIAVWKHLAVIGASAIIGGILYNLGFLLAKAQEVKQSKEAIDRLYQLSEEGYEPPEEIVLRRY